MTKQSTPEMEVLAIRPAPSGAWYGVDCDSDETHSTPSLTPLRVLQVLRFPLKDGTEDCRKATFWPSGSPEYAFEGAAHSRVSFVPGSQQECWLRYRSPVKIARDLYSTTVIIHLNREGTV